MEDGIVQVISELEGGPIEYQVRGHVDKREFVDAVANDFGAALSESQVVHAYVRNVPVPTGGMIMVNCAGPARGAYPVTCADYQ